jgi:hypothetical protein
MLGATLTNQTMAVFGWLDLPCCTSIGILETLLSAQFHSYCSPGQSVGLLLCSPDLLSSAQGERGGEFIFQYAALPLASVRCCQIILVPTSSRILWCTHGMGLLITHAVMTAHLVPTLLLTQAYSLEAVSHSGWM